MPFPIIVLKVFCRSTHMGKTKDYKYTLSLDLYLERHSPSFKPLAWDHEPDWFIAPTLALDHLNQIYFQDTKNRDCGGCLDDKLRLGRKLKLLRHKTCHTLQSQDHFMGGSWYYQAYVSLIKHTCVLSLAATLQYNTLDQLPPYADLSGRSGCQKSTD